MSCVGTRETQMSEELDSRFALEMGTKSGMESSDGDVEVAMRAKTEAKDVEIDDDRMYVEGPMYLAKVWCRVIWSDCIGYVPVSLRILLGVQYLKAGFF